MFKVRARCLYICSVLVGKLIETERQVLAEQEKTIGNEYYQANEIEEAIKFYTASIVTWPTAKAYNNRAACCEYSTVSSIVHLYCNYFSYLIPVSN